MVHHPRLHGSKFRVVYDEYIRDRPSRSGPPGTGPRPAAAAPIADSVRTTTVEIHAAPAVISSDAVVAASGSTPTRSVALPGGEDRAGMFNLNDMRIRYTSLPVLPVYVHSPGLVTIEYALLDWGSQLTLINAQVARRHNLTGPSMLSQVGTIHLDSPRRNAMRVDFSVESLDRSIAFDLTGIEACEELDISRPALVGGRQQMAAS